MIRSFLFAPATSERKVLKALDGDADAVIIDLEDAVAIDQKPAARRGLVDILARRRSRPAYVRVNALATPFCFRDLTEVAGAGLDGIVLPKVEHADEIRTVDWILSQIEAENGLTPGRIDLVPIIETARGIAAAAVIATAASRLRRICFGAVDLALDMDLDLDDETGAIAQARFAIALASRVAGLDGPIDTAFIHIGDPERLRASAVRARALGYTGKCCIHPTQVPFVNEVFSPSPTDVDRARRIVAAFEEAERAGSAAVSLDGVMIDYPVVDKARRLLAGLGPSAGAVPE